MREVVLDTETTGLDPETGHRIVEIGCVELISHMPTGRTYHQYINPDREMPPDAFAVHGISNEFLADKPRFAEIADAFLAFVGDAKLVIHNASFDIMFLNAELRWAAKQQFLPSVAIDTLTIARRRFPGAQNSLDALCRRYGVDNSARRSTARFWIPKSWRKCTWNCWAGGSRILPSRPRHNDSRCGRYRATAGPTAPVAAAVTPDGGRGGGARRLSRHPRRCADLGACLGRALGTRGCLTAQNLVAVERHKVNVFKVQRWVSPVPRRIADIRRTYGNSMRGHSIIR